MSYVFTAQLAFSLRSPWLRQVVPRNMVPLAITLGFVPLLLLVLELDRKLLLAPSARIASLVIRPQLT